MELLAPDKTQDVALYLRKSRDESDGTEDVLAKHELRLVELAKRNGWNIVDTYKEIGTSQYIEARDEMKRLLVDVSHCRFDAVLVVDLDRVSRGGLEEYGRIKRIFAESETLLITPSKVVNYSDESQEFIQGVEHLVGRQEYIQIRKRMVEGKIGGIKQGKWTNGKPPYPYIYDRNTRTIVVDESKRDSYNLIKRWSLEEDMPCYKIAWELNKLGFASPAGKKWSENAVYRVLTSEVHCGYVIYGKTSGSGHKNKFTKPLLKKDEDNWVKAEGTHEVTKTKAEHEQIMAKLKRKQMLPKEARTLKKRPLSGILYCGQCGGSLQFNEKSNGRLMVKTCQKADPIGNRCGNSGIYMEHIYIYLNQELDKFEQELLTQAPKQNAPDTSTLEIALGKKRQDMKELQKALERAEDMLLRGKFDEEKYERYEKRYTAEIDTALRDIDEIEASIKVLLTSKTDADRLEAIQVFKEAFNGEDTTAEDLNVLAKAIFDRVEYVRQGDNVQVKVKFQ